MTDLGISGLGDATLIASGGSALVYAATDEAGNDVAVKLLRGIRGAEVTRRFEREQQAAERLQEHPHIIDVHRTGVSRAGEPYLVMPLLRRGSLADELDSGVFPLDRAIDDVLAATEAIDFAHRRGVLHRDIKPGNLLRTDDDSVVVTDFGIARVVDAGITSATVGATTPLYAAPELLSENEASVQSDVYGLAAVLYALLAGAPAFSDSANIWATIARIRSEEPPPIALVPAPVMRVVHQGMAKDPADRPPTAHQFHLNLLAARDAADDWEPPSPAQITIPAPPPGPAMVPAVVIEPGDSEPSASTPRPAAPLDVPVSAPVTPTATPDPAPDAPAAPRRVGSGTKALAAVAALLLIGGLTWFGVARAFGGSEDPDDEITAPIDTSLPPPTAVPDDPDIDDIEDTTVTDDADANDADANDDADADTVNGAVTTPTPTDRLVSFTGTHFSAYFPEGWSVVRSDIDVGYGYRSQFVGPDDMYLNVDTTPAERRTGSQSIAASAREIAASIRTASAVTSEEIDGLEIHSFTFRNNRGVDSIDIFFEVDGDGYAIVAGSNTQTDAAFAIARQVALTIRSAT